MFVALAKCKKTPSSLGQTGSEQNTAPRSYCSWHYLGKISIIERVNLKLQRADDDMQY
jgi:hypothetical protein